jgi:hypothetical protein
MKVIFAEYLKTSQSSDIETFIFASGKDYGSITVKAQKQLLKQNNLPQKGWTAIAVDDEVFGLVHRQFTNISFTTI